MDFLSCSSFDTCIDYLYFYYDFRQGAKKKYNFAYIVTKSEDWGVACLVTSFLQR